MSQGITGPINYRCPQCLYWYPEAIPLKDHSIWNGGATALFDKGGHALPAISCLAE
jgi:hypothetical protein